ncbi:MAG: rRNA maturation RNase YbeY [Dehalococcoidaceae bacterium]|nr:rRNA maturation RNase YbeY [Dehalococcoidaceae bacterium]|tara:strand:+ start:184 stop:633 length:450 start_codon:yes stop_codon:yes gene_type:complete
MNKNIVIQCKNVSKVPLTKKNINFLIQDLLHLLKIKTFKANIIFCSDKELKDLNNEFRNKDEVTDILTFPYSNDFPHLPITKEIIKMNGDIFIATEYSLHKAMTKKISHTLELKHLIVHGVLHLLNYDHDTNNDDFLEIEESILGNNIH